MGKERGGERLRGWGERRRETETERVRWGGGGDRQTEKFVLTG